VRDAANSDFTFLDGITIQVDVFRMGKEFSARGVISTALTLPCVRCLDDFAYPLEAQFHYTLCPSDSDESLPEMEVRRDDLDVVHYKGSSIDLVPLLVEQIMVTIPTHPLCGETCKGICQQCGENLNNRLCQCSRENEPISAFERKSRTHDCLSPVTMTACQQCGETKLPHHVCPHCGTYKNREVIKVEEV
jgi:uncharacterized protein